jgi:hypothetical protein
MRASEEETMNEPRTTPADKLDPVSAALIAYGVLVVALAALILGSLLATQPPPQQPTASPQASLGG